AALLWAILDQQGDPVRLAHSLRGVPLFRDAPGGDLASLWSNLLEERVSAGDLICRRGERGERFYIMRSGSVEVRLGTGQDGLLLYRLGPGNCFGEMSLLMDTVPPGLRSVVERALRKRPDERFATAA